MITEIMTVRELVRAIRARRACRHPRARAFLVPDLSVVRVLCDDCSRRSDIDRYRLGLGYSSAEALHLMTKHCAASLARLVF